ncbi:hypothetical protein [Kitasatospora sp. GP82]|uniref:hypothetical protein n=1 Tax=Kitasatospora sp. GP82 TaxID=3035089 RepID=UPI0024765EA1|nr:hypothetical protein [Kitasatospora sp. GP82]MDH6128648.1 hypothetical protein [Kitasatospora sp. GP82]
MAKALGVCAAAATIALTIPNSAYAAHGFLIIDGVAHRNPSGCYPLGDFVPSVVTNQTDAVAEVWSGPDCKGQVDWLVYPGETYRPNGSRSVFVL